MPVITFDRFELGIDLRKGRAVADANRLRDLKNAYVTSGWHIQKRPGLTTVGSLSSGTAGLTAFDGKLHTYSALTNPSHNNTLDGIEVDNHPIPYTDDAADDVDKLHYAEPFNGALYVAMGYESGEVEHHYLTLGETWLATTAYVLDQFAWVDTGTPGLGMMYKVTTAGTSGATEPTWPTTLAGTVVDGTVTWTAVTTAIEDVNCPHSKGVAKINSKIYAIGDEVVDYSATDDPLDWTTSSDAGFLPVGTRAPGSAIPRGLGDFEGQLVVFMQDASQIWAVDPDPSLNSLVEVIGNLGTQYTETVNSVSGDLFFLSDVGFRSIALQTMTENLQDLDVGTPIDPLVQASLEEADLHPTATYYAGGGQYICAMGTRLYVYSYSKLSKVSAWSYYDIPFQVEGMAQLGNDLYLRSGDTIYKLDKAAYTDDGETFEVLAELPYQAFKKPSVLKMILGCDLISLGTGTVSHRYDASDVSLITDAVEFSDDTRPGAFFPVELSCTEIAPVIKNDNDEDFTFYGMAYEFESLGIR